MEPHQIAWLIRYLIIGTAECCSILVILTVIIGRLYRYTSCLIIFLMQISYAIVNVNALLYSDRFTSLKSPFIVDNNVLTEEQPWNNFCKVQSYLIHSSWMTSFFLSLVLVTFQYWILSNNLYRRVQYKAKMLWLCIIIPLIINAAPFFYPQFGFGPNGFRIPSSSSDDKWQSVYFFCGWKSPLPQSKDFSKRMKQQLAYGLNFMLPLLLGLIYEVYLLLRIRRVKRIFVQEGITISKEQQYITKLHKIPLYLFVILVFNMVFRLLPVASQSWTPAMQYIILFWDFVFDLIPILSSYQFFRFVRTSMTVPRLRWLSRPQEQASLLTQKSQHAGLTSQLTVTSN